MRKFRIGKDISFRWTILTNGEGVPLEGRDLRVVMTDPLKRQASVDFSTEYNVIISRFPGVKQKSLGRYTLTLWENFGQPNQTAVDACNAFELVSYTCQEGGVAESLDIETVDLGTSDICVGVKGASAYEIAVANGFVGSEEEWLASLKGEKGDAFTYGDFTPEQIKNLQKPALDAAKLAEDAAKLAEQEANNAKGAAGSANTAAELANRVAGSVTELEKTVLVAETQRAEAERIRLSNETTRQQEEQSRSKEEQSRVLAEQSRVSAETARQQAEQQRATEFSELKQESENATENANTAAQSANTAAKNANNKVAELVQFEGRLSETYENFAAIEASGETDTNKIYIDAETNTSYRWNGSEFVSIGGSPKGGYYRALFETAGVKYNEETGFYELNGLTDITESEMLEIYNFTNSIFLVDGQVGYKRSTSNRYRTILIKGFDSGYRQRNFNEWQWDNSVIERIPDNVTFNASSLRNAFWGCKNLVYGGRFKLDGGDGSAYIGGSTVNLNNKLEEIYISKMRANSSFRSCPVLNYNSYKYLIDEATNTAAITVTVHPTTYSYLTGTAEPTEQVGGTTEEWQALVTTALEKQITFVSA